ncbi:MAG: hypothetical protein EOM51_07415 [Clostridia bacterium]|nr:hypothetical protein [Clostridia bacterium]
MVLSDAGAVPEDAELFVVPITQQSDGEEYSKVEEKINENVGADNQTVTGFLAYDIYFMANGTEYEPELGTATVTIQYKIKPFDEAVEEATEEIKVLHLEESDSGVRVVDVTQAVDLLNTGLSLTPAATLVVGAEESTEENPAADAELSAAKSVSFVTNSFSTFVITGVASNVSKINVSLEFYTLTGEIDTAAPTGTYYLYVCDSANGYGYNLPLSVASGKGSVTASITGLYKKTSETSNAGLFYSLARNTTYTAILYSSTTARDKYYRYAAGSANTVYALDSDIATNYTITTFSDNAIVNSSGIGNLVITATKKAGTAFSSAEIYGMLTSVQPFAVVAEYFKLGTHMEGSIAVNSAHIGAGFGNSGSSYSNYSSQTSENTIKVFKKYNGYAEKTFRFGLYKSTTDCSGTTITKVAEQSLTLSDNGSGTVSFSVSDSVGCYMVKELDSDGNIITEGSTSADGFKLDSVTEGSTVTTASSFNTSYINSFESIAGDYKLNTTNGNGNNYLIVGAGTIANYNQGNCVSSGGMIYTDNYKGILAASATYPMLDVSGILGSMSGLSAQLAQAQTTSTVLVKNYTAAQMEALGNGGLTISTGGKFLLINIDATDDSTLSFNAAAPLTANGGTAGGWTSAATTILINVYTKSLNDDGTTYTYSPYTGTIEQAQYVMGMLLAPCATVQNFTTYNGKIIANRVISTGGEIHGCLWGESCSGSESKTWTFVNSATASLVLPETGGIGTYIFYGVGGGIVLLAAVMMIIYQKHGKRKKHKRKNGGPDG